MMTSFMSPILQGKRKTFTSKRVGPSREYILLLSMILFVGMQRECRAYCFYIIHTCTGHFI